MSDSNGRSFCYDKSLVKDIWGSSGGQFKNSLKYHLRDFLAVQWLRRHDFAAGNVGAIRGYGCDPWMGGGGDVTF